MSPDITARLENLNIQLTLSEAGYAAFVRDGLMAIALCEDSRVVSLGSTGIMTDNGLAYLSWRDGQPVLASHGGNEMPATAEQAAAIRQFSSDLKSALGLGQ